MSSVLLCYENIIYDFCKYKLKTPFIRRYYYFFFLAFPKGFFREINTSLSTKNMKKYYTFYRYTRKQKYSIQFENQKSILPLTRKIDGC